MSFGQFGKKEIELFLKMFISQPSNENSQLSALLTFSFGFLGLYCILPEYAFFSF